MAICTQCKHFRRVKPPSQLLAVAIGTTDAAISNALTKMGEDEQKQKEEEATYKKQQALTDRIDAAWATRPVMSEYCGLREADGDYLIAEIKNRDHQCAEFEAGRPELHRCSDCLFRVGAAGNAIDAKWEKSFVDSSTMNTAVSTSTSTSDNLLNKYRDGVGPRKAFDITGAYQSKGIMTIKPVYLDYCGKLSIEDENEFVVCILQNSHQTCQYWQRKGASEAENDWQPQSAATASSVLEMAPTESERASPVSQASADEAEPKRAPLASDKPLLTVAEIVAEGLRKHSTIPLDTSQPETAETLFQTISDAESMIGNMEQQEKQVPAESPQPAQEPDPSKVELVRGNPPLTQELVNLVAAYWEWALDIKLDAQGRAILQQDCVKDWEGKNKRETIESMANMLKTFELLKQADASTRIILHEQTWVSMITGMQHVRSNFNDWLTKAYYAANPPLAPGHPPLTRKMCDATLEVFNFLVHLEPFIWEKNLSTPKRTRDFWAKNLSSTYTKLSPDQQQFYVQMPALWAVLCENWRHASEEERDWLIAQWHQQITWWTRDWSENFRSQMMQEHAKADSASFFNDPNDSDPYEPSPFIPSLSSGPPTMPRMDASAPVAGISPGASSRTSEDAISEAVRKISEETAQDEGKVPETPEEATELQKREMKRQESMALLSNMMNIGHGNAMNVIRNLRV